MMTSLPPFLIFYVGALLVPVTSGIMRSILLLAIPVIGALNLFFIDPSATAQVSLFGYQLDFLRLDKLSLLFGYLFHLAAFLAVVYALHVEDRMEQCGALIYAGSAIGAVFAADLISLFVFWEMMAVSSMFVLLARGGEKAVDIAMRYLLVQVASGVILLAGIMLRIHETGSIAFNELGVESLSGWLILGAFGIKAAFPLVHNWLTEAYPEGTPTGSVVLAAFSTKTAIYALARGYAGTEILIYVGAVMAVFPMFLALFENDLRRVLAYCLINQLGFMVVGVGVGTALAINGVAAHAFSHVLYKGILFMGMGAVLHRTGKMGVDELGGLYRTMPITALLYILGALAMSFPLFSGFISKSFLVSSAAKAHYDVAWLCLLFGSAGVFFHAGLRVPYAAFFGEDRGLRPLEAPRNMLIAMGLGVLVCVAVGCFPALIYGYLPNVVKYQPYTVDHVLTQIQLLAFTTLAFALALKFNWLPTSQKGATIDAEWVYRAFLPRFGKWATAWYRLSSAYTLNQVKRLFGGAVEGLYRHHGPRGVFARSWQTGNMAFWTTLLLGAYLVVYYL